MQQPHAPTWPTAMMYPHPSSGFSQRDLEVEHRLTKLELASTKAQEASAKMEKRVALQERGLLLVIIAVTALGHERMPWLVKLLVSLVRTAG